MIHLVLLHGNLGSFRDWEPCLTLWEEHGIACHTVDLWRLLADGPLSLDAAGERIRTLAPASAPCVLAGYSLGGRLALHAAAQEPGFWKGLALLSANPGLAEENERARRLEADLLWAQRCRENTPTTFLTQWNAQSVFEGATEAPDPDYDPQAAALAFDCWSLGRQRDWAPWLRSTPLPLLWLTGERDTRFTTMAARCRSDALRVLPGAGHRLLREAPEAVARHVVDFVLSLPCSAPC